MEPDTAPGEWYNRDDRRVGSRGCTGQHPRLLARLGQSRVGDAPHEDAVGAGHDAVGELGRIEQWLAKHP